MKRHAIQKLLTPYLPFIQFLVLLFSNLVITVIAFLYNLPEFLCVNKSKIHPYFCPFSFFKEKQKPKTKNVS